jgi:hypothetical protein
MISFCMSNPAARRRPRRNRHFRIDDELKPSDLEAYLAYLREPRTTNTSAHAWLVARGYSTFSESAVARHKRFYLERFADEAEALERARQWAILARDAPQAGGDLVAGAVTLSEAMLVRELFACGGEPVSDEDLERFGQLVSRMVNTRAALTKMDLSKGTGGKGADSAAAPPMTDAQRDEAIYRKTCEILKVPYRTPGQRAESAKAWEQFEKRRAQGQGAPSEN